MSLYIKNLKLGYEEKIIINDITISIPKGKITMLIGANGCGKSTLLHGMSRLLKPISGEVSLNGVSVHEYKPKEFAKKLAILAQGPIAPEGITVRELCYFGRNPYKTIFGSRTVEDDDMVDWAIEATGMKEFEGRMLDSLSGGQRQRAWIAMALTQGTDILLLDEPTTYLDLSHQIEVLELLKELNRKFGKTIVIVHHELNQAAKYGDNLICMKSGQVKVEVAQYVRFRRAARLGPAVQQTAAFVVSRDGRDLGPRCQKGIQKCVPHRRFTVKLFQHDADGAVHRVDVVIHRACDLADDLGTVRARALHNSTAVAAQKQRGAEDQRRHGHAGDQRCRQDYGAGRALHGRASPAARARRSATGDVPLYFLKQ